MLNINTIALKKYLLLIVSVVAFFVAILFELQYNKTRSEKEIVDMLQVELYARAEKIETYSQHLKDELRKSENVDLWENPTVNFNRVKSHDIHLFVYRGDSLMFWNSNSISIPRGFDHSPRALRFIKLRNAWCLIKSDSVNGYHFFLFSPIKFEFQVENSYIKNRFVGIDLPTKIALSDNPYPGWHQISTTDGRFFAAVNCWGVKLHDVNHKYASIGFYLLALLLFLLGFFYLLKNLTLRKSRVACFNWFIFIELLLFLTISLTKSPRVLTSTNYFAPEILAMPWLFNSLGVLMLFSLFWTISSYLFYKHLPIVRFERSRWYKPIGVFVLLWLFVEIISVFLLAIQNSTVSLELYNIREISVYTISIYGALFLLFSGWFFLVMRFFKNVWRLTSIKNLLSLLAVSGIALVFLVFLLHGIAALYSLLFAMIICLAMYLFVAQNPVKYSFTHFFILNILFSCFVAGLVWVKGKQNEDAKQQTVLLNLTVEWLSERDDFSETLLEIVYSDLMTDDTLNLMVHRSSFDYAAAKKYLENRYLIGHLKSYDIEQLIVCNGNSGLNVDGNEQSSNCYTYFGNYLDSIGSKIGDSDFYFQNNQNGRISYFGWIRYIDENGLEVSLFIDLQSRIISKGEGYPQLLKDNTLEYVPPYEKYNYARYFNNQLITYSGDFKFQNHTQWIPQSKNEYNRFVNQGFEHLVYRPNSSEVVVVSLPVRKWFDFLLFITYLFLFHFLALFLYYLVYRVFAKIPNAHVSFAGRMRIMVISILLLSFMLVGAISTYFNVQQLTAKQQKDLRDKSKSVILFLKQALGNAENLQTIDPNSLITLLQEVSNIMYVDINLYNPKGYLVATSRPLIFDRQLFSKQISPRAFHTLKSQGTQSLLLKEQLEGLSYTSAYYVINSFDNKLLGYMNVPFFVSSDEISRDTTNYIVVLINVYLVFVLITLFFTLIISRELARPIMMLRQKLSGFKLHRKNEKIEYRHNDEIGDLVKQYNRLVDELSESAKQLALNERELAWRDMARQIAHEIKNPLTPMKLNLQFLDRARLENRPDFDALFSKTVQAMVEQIDNLSNIASNFSTFAKMPAATPSKVDVVEKALNVTNMFLEYKHVTVTCEPSTIGVFYAWVDTEQLNRVFINLIKNGVQSIPYTRNGEVSVFISSIENSIMIEVRDNGSGISDEIKSKLFTPNFTTKSSGMGLGLNIVKNIVSLAGGQIWYESKEGLGTSFFVQIPKYSSI